MTSQMSKHLSHCEVIVMSDAKFDIYFSGELLPNQDPEEVRGRVGALFKVNGSALDKLFSGSPVRIKQQVDAETARRYQKAIQKAGAFAEMRLVRDTQAVEDSPQPAAEQAAPPTESETPAPVSGAPMGDDKWSLAPVGATVDDTPQPPELQVDTSELSATPANSGSLEDCVVEKPPVSIPDISRLQLEDD